MSFIVSGGGANWQQFKLKAPFYVGACSSTVEVTVPGPGAIAGAKFSGSSTDYSFSGQFDTLQSASGQYSFTSNYIYSCGYFTQSGTWTAHWDGPAPQGIYGRVTYNGSAAAGIPLQLRHYNGSSWSTQTATTTDSDGRYRFQGVPSLASGAKYSVLFGRNTTNSDWVSFWVNPDITDYTAGSAVLGGNFDLANIALSSPAHGYSTVLPISFQWAKRSVSGDTYRWLMFDPDTDDSWITSDLGPASSFALTALPSGATYGKLYGWWVRAYQGANSYGYSFEARGFTMLSAASSADGPAASAQQETGLSGVPPSSDQDLQGELSGR